MLVINSTSECPENTKCGDIQYQDEDDWCCEQHVQLWINTIDENESLHDEYSPKTSTLVIPISDDDEMEIGADAHHYNHHKILLSPRLSPLLPLSPLVPYEHPDADNLSATNLSAISTGNISDAGSSLRDLNIKILEACKPANIKNNFQDELMDDVRIAQREDTGSLPSYGSSFDNPSSLAAVLQPDPEEILLNLGFGGASDLLLLQTVPSRFLQQPSTLSGIDVQAFQKTLLISEVHASSDSTSSVLRRFSTGSLSCDSSVNSLNAEYRRVLFKSTHSGIPSIHLSYDADCCPSPSTTSVSTENPSSSSMESTQRGRLSTLAELPEPSSRRSSFEEELSKEVAAAFSNTLDSVSSILADETSNLTDVNNSQHDRTEQMEEDAVNNHICDMYTNLVIPSIKRSDSEKSGSSNTTIIPRDDLNVGDALPINASLFKPITDEIGEESPANDIHSHNEIANTSASSKRALFQNHSTSKYSPEDNDLETDTAKFMVKTEDKVELFDDVVITNNAVPVHETVVRSDPPPMTDGVVEGCVECDVAGNDEVMRDVDVMVVDVVVVDTLLAFEEATGNDDKVLVHVCNEGMTNVVDDQLVEIDEMFIVANNISVGDEVLLGGEGEIVHENFENNAVMCNVIMGCREEVEDTYTSEVNVNEVSDQVEERAVWLDDDIVVSDDTMNTDTYPRDADIKLCHYQDEEAFATNTTTSLEEEKLNNCKHKVFTIQKNAFSRTFSIGSVSEVEQRNVKTSDGDDDKLIDDPQVFADTQKLIEEIKEILSRPNASVTRVSDDTGIINDSNNELQMINTIRDILLKPSYHLVNNKRDYITNDLKRDEIVENDKKDEFELFEDVTMQKNNEDIQPYNHDIIESELLRSKICTSEQSLEAFEVNDSQTNECINSDFELFEMTKEPIEMEREVSIFSNVVRYDDITCNEIVTPNKYAEEILHEKTSVVSGCDPFTCTRDIVLNEPSINTNITLKSPGNNTCVNEFVPVPGSGDDVFEKDDDLNMERCPLVLKVNAEQKLVSEQPELENISSGNNSGLVPTDSTPDVDKSSTFNEAFKDFFWKLKQDSKKACVPISNENINEDNNKGDKNENINEDGNKKDKNENINEDDNEKDKNENINEDDNEKDKYENTDSLSQTGLVQDDDVVVQQDIKTNSENKKSAKSYLTAAFHSLTAVLGKYQDSKRSKCCDNVCNDKEKSREKSVCEVDVKNLKSQKQKSQKNNYFNLFNHRTADLQTDNFSVLAANIVEGKVETDVLEGVKIKNIEEEEVVKASSHNANVIHDNSTRSVNYCTNCKVNQTFSSQSSIEKIPDIPISGYIPDSPVSSDEHASTSIRSKRKRCTTKLLEKGVSMESSGFEEDSAKHKCPFGKRYGSTNSPSYIPSHSPHNILPLAKEIEKLMSDTKCCLEHNYRKCDCGGSNYGFISDGHFEYVIQQLTRVRTEINTHFDLQAKRENELKLLLNNQVSEMKQIMTSEYMGWILRQMECLKGKLKEKDEEIETFRRGSYERH